MGIENFTYFAKNSGKYKIFHSQSKNDADDTKTFSDPLFTVPACMLPELHAFKVLFYAEAVGMVTSGHATKMVVTPFDPQQPKPLRYMQPSWLYLL